MRGVRARSGRARGRRAHMQPLDVFCELLQEWLVGRDGELIGDIEWLGDADPEGGAAHNLRVHARKPLRQDRQLRGRHAVTLGLDLHIGDDSTIGLKALGQVARAKEGVVERDEHAQDLAEGVERAAHRHRAERRREEPLLRLIQRRELVDEIDGDGVGAADELLHAEEERQRARRDGLRSCRLTRHRVHRWLCQQQQSRQQQLRALTHGRRLIAQEGKDDDDLVEKFVVRLHEGIARHLGARCRVQDADWHVEVDAASTPSHHESGGAARLAAPARYVPYFVWCTEMDNTN